HKSNKKLEIKIVFNYDLIIYLVGVILIVFEFNFPMLLVGTVNTGIAVGAGVPVSWNYIAEQSPKNKRAAHVGTAQLAWSVGPMITFALAVLVAPLGLLGSRLIFLHLFIIAGIALYIRRGLPESEVWEEEQRKAKLAKENKIVKPK